MVEEELCDLSRMLDRKADIQEIQSFSKPRSRRNSFHSKLTRQSSLSHTTEDGEEYVFGENTQLDFDILFSIFNRIAKRKLDAITLAKYSSIVYVDSIYKQMNVEFSSQINETTLFLREQIDTRIRDFRQKIYDFKYEVEAKLDEIEAATSRLRKMTYNIIANQNQTTAKNYESSQSSRADLPLLIQRQRSFSHTRSSPRIISTSQITTNTPEEG